MELDVLVQAGFEAAHDGLDGSDLLPEVSQFVDPHGRQPPVEEAEGWQHEEGYEVETQGEPLEGAHVRDGGVPWGG